MGRKVIDLTGQKFGKLTVIRMDDSDKWGKLMWLCKCECGNEKTIQGNRLKVGKTQSCGCLRLKNIATHSFKYKSNNQNKPINHGKSGTPEHCAWANMIQRCENANHPWYKDYGGRGIRVCERWQRFENFYTDMGDKPTAKHSIDRIDVNKGYEPSNCKWATATDQSRNQRLRKTNKSGTAGVSWNKRDKKWEACISVNSKPVKLGYFTDKEDAISARKNAEIKYWEKSSS